MSAPFQPYPASARNICDEASLAAMIDAWTKRQITDAYSFGLCTEELAIRLLRENNLVSA